MGPISILSSDWVPIVKTWSEDYSMLRVHVCALNCDPSKCNCVCVYDYIMTLSLSRCMRLHVCCTSSVVLQENQVIVQTGMWSLLAVAKNVSVYHDAQSIGLFVSWFT